MRTTTISLGNTGREIRILRRPLPVIRTSLCRMPSKLPIIRIFLCRTPIELCIVPIPLRSMWIELCIIRIFLGIMRKLL
jgi:hypothetical protein